MFAYRNEIRNFVLDLIGLKILWGPIKSFSCIYYTYM